MKYLIFLLLSFSAQADGYIDLSIEAHAETYDSFYQSNGEPIRNLIGGIEVGYEFDNYSIFVRHISSVQQEDTGLNTLGIKIRMQ